MVAAQATRQEDWRHIETGAVYRVTLADSDLANPIAVVGPVRFDTVRRNPATLAHAHVLNVGVQQAGLPEGDFIVLDPSKGDVVPPYRTE